MGKMLFGPVRTRLMVRSLVLSLALVLVVAAPVLAQGDIGDVNEGDDQFNVGDETVYSAACQNILGSFEGQANQYANADAIAVGGDDAAAVAEIAQEQNVSVSQVNECLNRADVNGDGVVEVVEVVEVVKSGSSASGTASASAATSSATASASSSATALPATGGPVLSSALALGAAVLLVGGGLLARRIVR